MSICADVHNHIVVAGHILHITLSRGQCLHTKLCRISRIAAGRALVRPSCNNDFHPASTERKSPLAVCLGCRREARYLLSLSDSKGGECYDRFVGCGVLSGRFASSVQVIGKARATVALGRLPGCGAALGRASSGRQTDRGRRKAVRGKAACRWLSLYCVVRGERRPVPEENAPIGVLSDRSRPAI